MFSYGACATTFRNAYVSVEYDGGGVDGFGIQGATDTRQKVWDGALLGRVLREDVRLGQYSHLVVATPHQANAFVHDRAGHR